jgi:hypothetical protein
MGGSGIDIVIGLIPVGILILFVLWRVIINIDRITGPRWTEGSWRRHHTPWRHGHPAVNEDRRAAP